MSQQFKIKMYFNNTLEDPTVDYGTREKICEVSDILANARIDIGIEVTSLFMELYKEIPGSYIYEHDWELARLILRKLARSIYVWRVSQPLRAHTVWNTDKDNVWYLCLCISPIKENNADDTD